MQGIRNNTVEAVRIAAVLRTMRRDAARKAASAERTSPQPMSREARVAAYAGASGWETPFTPRQRRRLGKKERHAQARAARAEAE